jgi:hypothetical protein
LRVLKAKCSFFPFSFIIIRSLNLAWNCSKNVDMLTGVMLRWHRGYFYGSFCVCIHVLSRAYFHTYQQWRGILLRGNFMFFLRWRWRSLKNNSRNYFKEFKIFFKHLVKIINFKKYRSSHFRKCEKWCTLCRALSTYKILPDNPMVQEPHSKNISWNCECMRKYWKGQGHRVLSTHSTQ